MISKYKDGDKDGGRENGSWSVGKMGSGYWCTKVVKGLKEDKIN